MAINCPGVCSQRYATGATVVLTATPDGISTFSEWHGPGVPTSPGTGTIKSGSGVQVDGTGTLFTTELVVGDYITAAGQIRKVTEITNNLQLKVLTQFSPTLTSATTFERSTHRLDNPLTVVMNGDKAITATFAANITNGALFAHSGLTSGASYDTTNKFGAITENTDGAVTSNSTSVVWALAPADFTITFLYVQAVSALGAGKSVTFKMNVNGSTSNAISVTLSNNNLTGFSTDGPLVIHQDDLICIEAATFNSVSSANIDHFALGIVSTL